MQIYRNECREILEIALEFFEFRTILEIQVLIILYSTMFWKIFHFNFGHSKIDQCFA